MTATHHPNFLQRGQKDILPKNAALSSYTNSDIQ